MASHFKVFDRKKLNVLSRVNKILYKKVRLIMMHKKFWTIQFPLSADSAFVFHPAILHGFRQFHQLQFLKWAPYYVSKSATE